jgi:aryl-alcohol dehydrogenase-like predicted oxidoreductase
LDVVDLISRVIPWSPIARGALAKPVGASSLRSETDSFLNVLGLKQVKDAEKEIINRVEELSKKKGYSMAQIATAWMLTKESIHPQICWANFQL